jgi:hypothetical protein
VARKTIGYVALVTLVFAAAACGAYLPDLVVDPLVGINGSCPRTEVQLVVKNTGGKASAASTISVQFSHKANNPVEVGTPAIESGSSVAVLVPIPAPLPDGADRVLFNATVDARGDIAESNETNNLLALSCPIPAAP